MTQAAKRTGVLFAEYVAMDRASPVKHQLVQGEVFDMSGGTPEHAALILNTGRDVGAQLRDKPCRAFSSDLRIRAGDVATYPDLSVVWRPLQRDPEDTDTILNPSVVIEVLSDSTEAFDRGRKFEAYRTIPSLVEYVLIDQHEPHVEVFTRTEQGWTLREARRGERLRLSSIDCEIEVDSIYEGVLEIH
jgi:Uma2 family endonuclease